MRFYFSNREIIDGTTGKEIISERSKLQTFKMGSISRFQFENNILQASSRCAN